MSEVQQDIPLKARILLSHAYFQNIATKNKIDVLHIKGYVFGADTYRPGRLSSDVDLLVRPAHVDRLVNILLEDGWSILTHFETGSIFEHASTIYHPTWGLADIHRYFPGLGYEDPVWAFEELWSRRRHKEIANFFCDTPSIIDARLLVIVHNGRSKANNRADTQYLKDTLTSEEWKSIEQRSRELRAELAFDTALGNIEKHKGEPYYLLWKAISEDVPPFVEWWARLERTPGLTAKLDLLKKIFFVNTDHLAMELGHSPSQSEIRERFISRFRFKRTNLS